MANNFFSIKTLSGENYFGRIVNQESIVSLGQDEGLDVITGIDTQDKPMIFISDVFVMAPTKTGMIPVEFSKMPMGSNRLAINGNHLTEICVLDSQSQFVKALENIKSGIVTETSDGGGIKNSSRKDGILAGR